MSNRDGKTAQKDTHNREYWSRRLPGCCWPWGKAGKIVTHRRERAAGRREEIKIKQGKANE